MKTTKPKKLSKLATIIEVINKVVKKRIPIKYGLWKKSSNDALKNKNGSIVIFNFINPNTGSWDFGFLKQFFFNLKNYSVYIRFIFLVSFL